MGTVDGAYPELRKERLGTGVTKVVEGARRGIGGNGKCVCMSQYVCVSRWEDAGRTERKKRKKERNGRQRFLIPPVTPCDCGIGTLSDHAGVEGTEENHAFRE
jgi:hypothetical protein